MPELGRVVAHKATHQDGGSDEISVLGLSGELSDEQKSNWIKITAAIATKTTTYTITSSDFLLLCNGTFTITLPTPVGISGRMYFVKNIGTGIVTLATAAATIDGQSTQIISAQYESITIISDGTVWHIV